MSQQQAPKQQAVNTQKNRQGRVRGFVVDSDEDAEDPASRKSKAAPSHAAKANQNRSGSSRIPQTLEKAQPLFLDSDDDVKDKFPTSNNDDDDSILNEDRGEFNDDAMTLQSSTLKTQEPSARQTRSSKPTAARRGTKKAPVIVDDDSDDGATFKGFRGKKRGIR